MKLNIVSILMVMALFGCGDGYQPPRALSAQEQALVTSSNTFGFDFFGQVVSEAPDDNVFVSPLSVSMALGMTYNGARNDTAAGMATALAYGDMDRAQVNDSYGSLIDLLTGMDPDVTLEIANAVWYRQGLDVLAGFVSACEQYFDAVVRALDFDDPGSVDAINSWVSEKTHGKIDSIVDGLDSLTMMLLVNAVYFKGDWTTQFEKDSTYDWTFHGAGGDSQVKMMMSPDDMEMAYTVTDAYQAARLPYGHEHFAMTILLPREGTTVDDLVASLNAASWSEMQDAMGEREIPLHLPRFELDYETTLNDTLSALGMEEAFDPDLADFSGISSLALFITEVRHKTYVKVNEEGTEAAAVTSVEMGVTAMPPEEMRVDRPFVFIIHDTHSQSMLFMGRILDL
jgi:serpin B